MTISLSTESLKISPLGLGDLDSFVAYRQDPEIARYQSWDVSFNSGQGLELIQSQLQIDFPNQGDWLQLAIQNRQTGELLGDLALHALEALDEYEIGFTLARRFQKQGFGYEAASALLSYLFDVKHAKAVIACTDTRNQASINLLLKLGFNAVNSRGWVEEFKGETVQVSFFETQRASN